MTFEEQLDAEEERAKDRFGALDIKDLLRRICRRLDELDDSYTLNDPKADYEAK